MKTSTTLSIVAALAFAGVATRAARADEPGRHPAYLHALSDLREARANLEHPNRASGTWDEKVAIAEIDGAIKEIKDAAQDDGKPLDDHPAVDAHLEWGGRVKHAEELLSRAAGDVREHEDDHFARGLKSRALKRIEAADELVKKGVAEAMDDHGGGGGGDHGGGDHPAYLHALADMRDVRALLVRPDGVRTKWEPRKTIEAVEESIRIIKKAAIDDGKNIDEHTPIDAALDWGGRIKHAQELLKAAYDDVDQHEDNKFARGIKRQALDHIHGAQVLLDRGAKEKWELSH